LKKNAVATLNLKFTTRLFRGFAWYGVFALSMLVGGCGLGGGGNGEAPSPTSVASEPAPACSAAHLEALEKKIDTRLSQAESEVDFSFALERKDGRRYSYNRGNSTLQTLYESASTSKLVSAVVIMRLVEQGYLSLADKPQNRINTWPIAPGDALYDMNLAQLLSMTSGVTSEPPCLNSASSNLEACAIDIATMSDKRIIPGEQFFYASGHHQVAGLMAVKARGFTSWSDLFTEFKAQTGLFGSSTFDVPSVNNPALASGMHLTGEDYLAFLHALKDGALLNSASMSELLADHTASSTIVFSPIRDGISGGPGLGEDWHYGLGLWHECRSAHFDCVPGSRVSSPGNFGSYPFWDRILDYTGIVIRQGVPGTLKRGIDIERFVRPEVEEWAAC
jgi:CubicO group peptidase (beta-lactamase class C family)